ncbi:MAG: hypothetical protein LBR26_09745, partial [Prevotella sp.]|nr:hypothetical protein [Prevotella sp.]
GGFDVDLAWENGKLSKAIVKANYNKTCRLRTKASVKVLAGSKEIKCTSPEENLIEFDAEQGEKYLILPINNNNQSLK